MVRIASPSGSVSSLKKLSHSTPFARNIEIYKVSNERRRECLYYLSLGHYKMGMYDGSGMDVGDGRGIPREYCVDVGEGMDGPGSGSSEIGLWSPCCWNGGAAPGGKKWRS